MSRRLALLIVSAATLAACSPEPRAASYFKAHPDEIPQVIADCKTGAHRGAECDNALTAKAQVDAEARMAIYKKSFSGQ